MAQWQIPDYLESLDGVLHVNGVDTLALAKAYGTPLFVFSQARICDNIAEIRTAFEAYHPRVRYFYASKANSNLAILQTVRQCGIDVEVNSGGELYKALHAGFHAEQIIFNGVGKTQRELEEAIRQQIFCINVDSPFELEQVIRIAQQLGLRANIALRIAPEVKTESHAGLETGTYKSKFGIAGDDLLPTYCRALSFPDAVNVVGLHMHIGAQVVDPTKHGAGFRALLCKAAQLHAATGHTLQFLNIGGGLSVSYIKPEDTYLPTAMAQDSYNVLRTSATPDKVASATLGSLDTDFMPELEAISPGFGNILKDITFILEPGSRIIADTALLLTTVVNHKYRAVDDTNWLILDAGFNTLADILGYNWYFHALAANKLDQDNDQTYKLAGPLCDGSDVYHDTEGYGRLPEFRLLPPDMQPDDVIAFLDVGGYTLEQMNQYNGQPRAAAVMVCLDGSIKVIRRRETYDDLIRLDVGLD